MFIVIKDSSGGLVSGGTHRPYETLETARTEAERLASAETAIASVQYRIFKCIMISRRPIPAVETVEVSYEAPKQPSTSSE